jgi:hypothetical protein
MNQWRGPGRDRDPGRSPRARALCRLKRGANQEDRSSQKRYLEEARSLYERLGNRRLLAQTVLTLAVPAIMERYFERARTLLREGRKIAAEIGDPLLLARFDNRDRCLIRMHRDQLVGYQWIAHPRP